MKSIVHFVAATAAIGALAAPAAAQYAPQTYPQYQQPGYPAYGQQPAPAPGQPGYAYTQQGYAQPGYAYGQQAAGYGQNPVADHRSAARQPLQCDRPHRGLALRERGDDPGAARYGNNGYGNYGYDQRYGGYNRAAAMRVTSITDVQRRTNGLRVSGTMTSAMAAGYSNQVRLPERQRLPERCLCRHNVSFRCNVDYRGQVTNVRIGGGAANGFRRALGPRRAPVSPPRSIRNPSQRAGVSRTKAAFRRRNYSGFTPWQAIDCTASTGSVKSRRPNGSTPPTTRPRSRSRRQLTRVANASCGKASASSPTSTSAAGVSCRVSPTGGA